MWKDKTDKEPQAGLTRWHKILIAGLLVIIVTAVIGHFLFVPDRSASLQIIYTSDIQGQLAYSEGNYAGYEKIAAVVEEASDKGNYVLLVDAGNCLGCSENAELDDGQSVISLMNAAGYDAMVPGPMDFVYGTDTLSSLRSLAEFPVLAANILKSDGSNAFETYQIININNVRVGIIGVTNGLSQTQASGESLTVEDPAETVEKLMQQLKNSTDVVIVLAYTGSEDTTRELADIDGVWLVIESGCEEAFSEVTASGTMIVSAGQKGSVIGTATLDITRDKAAIENDFCEASDYDRLTSDENVLEILAAVNTIWTSASSEQAGRLTAGSNSEEDNEEDTQTEEMNESGLETAVGDLITDAMLDAASIDGAEVAWITDSSIKGTLGTGINTRTQIYALFDDNLYLVTCKMTGGEIRSVLESSYDNYPNIEDFLQVSGITYTYTASTDIGSHLSDIEIGGNTLDDAQTYVVAMTSTLADQLGYISDNSGRLRNYRTMASVLFDYIQDGTSLVDADRITIIE